MDFSLLTRKELQALCKKNGIPANKTNAFMADALAAKTLPLSPVDGNVKKEIKKVEVAPDSVSKPSLFTNNFLRRGKRKDAPTPPCSNSPIRAGEGKTVSVSQKAKSEEEPVMFQDAAVGREQTSLQSCKPPLSKGAEIKKKARVAEVTPSGFKVQCLTTVSKEEIDAELDSSLTSRLQNYAGSPPASGVQSSSEKLTVSGVKGSSEQLTESKVQEQKHGEGNLDGIDADWSFPPYPLRTMDELVGLIPRNWTSSELADSPPLRLSPLLGMEERVLSIVDRVKSFCWKREANDISINAGSPL